MGNIIRANVDDLFVTVLAQDALSYLRGALVLGREVPKNTDSTRSFTTGEVLQIPVGGTFTANSKAEDADVTIQESNTSNVQVTLNQHPEVSFILEDRARAVAGQGSLALNLRAATIAVAESIEEYLVSVAQGATNHVGTYGTDISRTTLVAARKALNSQLAPRSNRIMVVSDKDEAALLNDSSLLAMFQNSANSGIREGSLGSLYGFDIYSSPFIVTDTAPTPDETKNIAMNRDAIAAAFRPLPMDAPGAEQATIVDEESGLALRVTIAYRPEKLAHQVTVDALYGASLVRPAATALVVRA